MICSNALRKDLFKGTAVEFIEAKLKERSERHLKQGGQRYVVEPNVKEGKGGLRDLQSLYWMTNICTALMTSQNWSSAAFSPQRNTRPSARPRIF